MNLENKVIVVEEPKWQLTKFESNEHEQMRKELELEV